MSRTPRTSRAPRAPRTAALVLLVTAGLLGGLTVAVAYGFALDYGNTGVGWWTGALDGLHGWWFGVAIVVVLTVKALHLAWPSRLVRWAAVVLVLATLVGTGLGAAIGAEQKLNRYPVTPDCTEGFASGPAVPVVRSAQASFEELDHPGPFSGGGSSGVDGCFSQLMVADGTDPRPAYRRSLASLGWTVESDREQVLRAVRGREAFELTAGERWTVWIGPAHLREPALATGEVGPRR